LYCNIQLLLANCCQAVQAVQAVQHPPEFTLPPPFSKVQLWYMLHLWLKHRHSSSSSSSGSGSSGSGSSSSGSDE
jgi:uncharacterized membrane protein YgcG